MGVNKKEGRILATQIMDFLTAQTDKLVLVGMLALIILSALQLAKMSRANRQLKYLTEKLAGYLKAVLEDEEEEDVSLKQLDDSYFTETLARIYVKQKRYDKALQIIKNLSLKYPEKNIYFADQIRFLEKLIINTKK